MILEEQKQKIKTAYLKTGVSLTEIWRNEYSNEMTYRSFYRIMYNYMYKQSLTDYFGHKNVAYYEDEMEYGKNIKGNEYKAK
jgi:hypothetical protein